MNEIKLLKCKKCKQVKSQFAFVKNKICKSGFESTCKECRAALGAKRNAETTRFLLKYAYERGCIDCGERNPLLLEFDHEEALGNKVSNISNLRCRSLNIIKEELDKCVVRCVACHRMKTAIDFGYYNLLEERNSFFKEYRSRQPVLRELNKHIKLECYEHSSIA